VSLLLSRASSWDGRALPEGQTLTLRLTPTRCWIGLGRRVAFALRHGSCLDPPAYNHSKRTKRRLGEQLPDRAALLRA
jgi:hypothetical protein